MIDRLSGRVALLIVVGACVALVILGWFVLISPERAKAAKLDNQISDVNSQLATVTALLESPAGHQSLISQRLFDKALPADPKVSQLLRQLTAMAGQAGIELDTITPGALVAGAGVETLPLALSVKGHYFALQNFLRILRTSADLKGDQVSAKGRLFTVDNISFTGGGSAPTGTTSGASSGAGNVITATIAANAFVYSPTSVAPAPVAPTVTTDTGTTTTP